VPSGKQQGGSGGKTGNLHGQSGLNACARLASFVALANNALGSPEDTDHAGEHPAGAADQDASHPSPRFPADGLKGRGLSMPGQYCLARPVTRLE
jgi:hypothetical protein